MNLAGPGGLNVNGQPSPYLDELASLGPGQSAANQNPWAGDDPTPGSYLTSGTWAGAAPAINLTVNVNAGTVVGQNAAQALVNLVMPQMVAQLRQAGVKI